MSKLDDCKAAVHSLNDSAAKLGARVDAAVATRAIRRADADNPVSKLLGSNGYARDKSSGSSSSHVYRNPNGHGKGVSTYVLHNPLSNSWSHQVQGGHETNSGYGHDSLKEHLAERQKHGGA